MPNNTQVPGIPEPRLDLRSLLATVQALKQTVEVMQGVRGNGVGKMALASQIADLQAQIKKLQG